LNIVTPFGRRALVIEVNLRPFPWEVTKPRREIDEACRKPRFARLGQQIGSGLRSEIKDNNNGNMLQIKEFV